MIALPALHLPSGAAVALASGRAGWPHCSGAAQVQRGLLNPDPTAPPRSGMPVGGATTRENHHTNEARVREYTLPALFPSGSTAGEWQAKTRPELLRLFRDHVYGHSPSPPADLGFYPLGPDQVVEFPGLYNCVRREVRVHFTGDIHGPGFTILLYLPIWASEERPVPIFLGCNFGGNHTVHPEPGSTPSLAVERQFAQPDRGRRGAAAHRWQVEMVVSRGYGLATFCALFYCFI